MRYLRAIGYFLMSQCATGPARESKVCPGRAAAGGFNLAARPLDRTRVLRIWGVHWVILEGCAFLYLPVIIGVCIPMHTHTNAHPLRERKCTPLYTSRELWSDPVGARRRRAKAVRSRAPRRSRMEENKPAHLSLLYDDCLVTQHP